MGACTSAAFSGPGSEVRVLPYLDLERIARDFPPLQRQLHEVMSREIVREQDVTMMLRRVPTCA